jgi:16S rRNA (guanine527-N7)-methyltransferase
MPVSDPPQEFQRICIRNGITLSEPQLALFSRFVGGVLDWNSKINLISRRDQENIWYSHVLHSLSLLFYIDFPRGARILDLGTGGGFPGIPLAIARPDVGIVLLDSIRKKTAAVEDMVGQLGLQGAAVWTGRAEEAWRTEEASGKFDFVVARAVASLRDLVHWSRPYLKAAGPPPIPGSGGRKLMISSPALVALKGGDLEKEIAEAKIKERISDVSIIRMSFEGSLELGLEDKKTLIVRL